MQSNALTFTYGSSPCGCSGDLRAARFNHFASKSETTQNYTVMHKLFLPSFILFVYDSRLAGQLLAGQR